MIDSLLPVPDGGSEICHIVHISFILNNPQTLYLLVSFHLLPYFSLSSIQPNFCRAVCTEVLHFHATHSRPDPPPPGFHPCPPQLHHDGHQQLPVVRSMWSVSILVLLDHLAAFDPLHLPCSKTFLCWFLRHHSLLILLLPLRSLFSIPFYRLHFHRPVLSTLIYMIAYCHLGLYVFGSASGLYSSQPPW